MSFKGVLHGSMAGFSFGAAAVLFEALPGGEGGIAGGT